MSDNTINALALVPRGFEEAEKLSEKLSKCSLLPDHFRGKPADVFWALAKGIELGITPTQAIEGIFVINGKPGMYVELMHAVILGSGMAEFFRPVEVTATSATWETKRKGDDRVHRKTVTMEQAKQAGWDRNAKYKTEPDVMLSARARGRLAKEIFPDVLRGMSPVEELLDEPPVQVFTPPPKSVIIDITEATRGAPIPRGPEPKQAAASPAAKAEEKPAAAPPAEEPARASESELRARDLAQQIRDAKTGEDLASLIVMAEPLVKKLGPKHPDALAMRKAYKMRKAELEEAA